MHSSIVLTMTAYISRLLFVLTVTQLSVKSVPVVPVALRVLKLLRVNLRISFPPFH